MRIDRNGSLRPGQGRGRRRRRTEAAWKRPAKWLTVRGPGSPRARRCELPLGPDVPVGTLRERAGYRRNVADEESRTEATGVGVLDRVIAILDAVEGAPMGASELARHLGLSVPTAHRLVGAMVKHDLLRRDAEGRHHPGQRFASSSLAAVAGPALDALSLASGETAQMWVRRGGDRLCLVSVESAAELRASLPVGTRLALSAGGSAARVLAGSDPLDPGHPDRRWFESVSQRTPGLCSVSAPVRQYGVVVAAVCLSAPMSRVDPEGPGEQFGDLVLSACERIEKLLPAR